MKPGILMKAVWPSVEQGVSLFTGCCMQTSAFISSFVKSVLVYILH